MAIPLAMYVHGPGRSWPAARRSARAERRGRAAPHETTAGGEQRHAGDPARRDVALLVADPAELVGEERRDGLPGEEHGDERRGSQPRSRDDRADDVERAERAAGPRPPGHVALAGLNRARGEEHSEEQHE